ncbi:right-handed parallel beta-helix repeat-containing protein [candidate division KSB1 bacterium]
MDGKIFLQALFMAMVTCSVPVNGEVYYVSPAGHDSNNGTINWPWKTIHRATEMVGPADKVLIRDGIYNITSTITFKRSGTKANPITFEAYPGEWPVIDGGKNCKVMLLTASWNVLRNFEVTNSNSWGIELSNASDNVLDGIVTHHNILSGLYLYMSSRIQMLRITSYSNYNPADGGGNSDGIGINSGTGNIFRNCVVYNNSDDGIDTWQSTHNRLENCISYQNGYDKGDGGGFKLGGAAVDGGNTVINCITYGNSVVGFNYNAADIPDILYNNTAWDNPTNYTFHRAAHVLRNNISYDGSVSIGDVVDDEHNSWNLGINDPEFISMDENSPDFMRLAPGSPCIDAGVDVGINFNGSAPDLGAIEYGTTGMYRPLRKK